MGNLVAIVGRPNVGKSTFFNRLVESRQAVVHEMEGVTRDRQYGKAEWNGIEFSVVDTGGYVGNAKDVFEKEICKQVVVAIEEADSIIFMVDTLTGITSLDEEVAKLLRKVEDKRVALVANKVDTSDRQYDANEFYKLGIKNVFCVSSINGFGTGDLLDHVVESFEKKEIQEETKWPKFAIIGRPNVGKSSLVNALIGEERNIVTPVSGTTRDSIYTLYSKYNFNFYLVDTAGIRKKGKVHEDVEFYSVMRSVRAIENADVCILLIDAQLGMESQDLNILGLAARNNKGVVILCNKWDLIEKDTDTTKLFEKNIKNKIAPFTNIPIIFTSVLNKQRIHKVLETAIEVHTNKTKRISTSVLNSFVQDITEAYPPPSVKGKHIKIKYAVQLPSPSPKFAFFCNLPQYVKEPYKRYIENKLREKFDFTGVPIRIFMRKK